MITSHLLVTTEGKLAFNWFIWGLRYSSTPGGGAKVLVRSLAPPTARSVRVADAQTRRWFHLNFTIYLPCVTNEQARGGGERGGTCSCSLNAPRRRDNGWWMAAITAAPARAGAL